MMEFLTIKKLSVLDVLSVCALDDERMDDALRDLLYSICYTSGSQTVVQVPPVVRER